MMVDDEFIGELSDDDFKHLVLRYEQRVPSEMEQLEKSSIEEIKRTLEQGKEQQPAQRIGRELNN